MSGFNRLGPDPPASAIGSHRIHRQALRSCFALLMMSSLLPHWAMCGGVFGQAPQRLASRWALWSSDQGAGAAVHVHLVACLCKPVVW